jgi:cell division protein FtsQ
MNRRPNTDGSRWNNRIKRRSRSGGSRLNELLELIRSARPFVLVSLLLMAMPIVGVQTWRYFRSSDHFTLKNVEVQGNVRVVPKEILAFAGVGVGQRILDLDENQLAREIERHPRIRSARVRVDLPDRITVFVEERGASAVVVLGRLYLADERGVVFKRAEDTDEIAGLPFITGMNKEELLGDEPHGSGQALVSEGIQLATAYAAHAVSREKELGELHHDALFGWTIVTADDAMEVRLGSGSLDEKLDRLHHIVRDLASRGARADVVRLDAARDPGRVAVRMQYVTEGDSTSKGDSKAKVRGENNRKRAQKAALAKAAPSSGEMEKQGSSRSGEASGERQ